MQGLQKNKLEHSHLWQFTEPDIDREVNAWSRMLRNYDSWSIDLAEEMLKILCRRCTERNTNEQTAIQCQPNGFPARADPGLGWRDTQPMNPDVADDDVDGCPLSFHIEGQISVAMSSGTAEDNAGCAAVSEAVKQC